MPFWKNARSVRGPLILAIVLILSVGFSVTNIISYQVSKSSLLETLNDNTRPLTSDNIYSEILQDLLRPIQIAAMMANDVFVKDWLLNGEQDGEKITQYLDGIRRKHGVFTSFLVSDKTKKYYHFTGRDKIVSNKNPADAWYFRVRDMKETSEINVDINSQQDLAMTVFINNRMFDRDGRFMAAIGVGLKLNTITEIVARYKDYFHRNVYFVDGAGNILAQSKGAMITKSNIHLAPGIKDIAKAVTKVDHGFFKYEINGDVMLLNARRIPELGWHVLVEQRESEALDAIHQGLMTNALVCVVAIVLTIFIVGYTVNLFHSRLEAMLADERIANAKMEDQAVRMASLAEKDAALNKKLNYEIDIKNRFFSIISHDLRSPFNSLLGMTHLMSQEAERMSKEKLVDYAATVNEAGRRVFDLLENLLEWSRFQMRQATLEPEMIALDQLARESIDVLKPTIVEKGITVTNNIEKQPVFADPHMARTVLRNLITNALKFTPQHGTVELTSQRDGDVVQVTIADTGNGMSVQQIEEMFSLDQVRSTAGTAGEQGTGLGLPLCKNMIDQNGGRIWVESVQNEGSRFHFTLPTGPGA
jgi:signal transduction histidine kinase